MSNARRREPRDDDDVSQRPAIHDVRAGGDVVGGDKITAGRDVAGRDIVHIDDRDVIQVGYSSKAVQRLVITVGVLVFVTAACFFSGGILIGARVFSQFDRLPINAQGQLVNSSEASALSMAHKIEEAKAIGAGDQYLLEFSEDELSSYIHFVIGPELGLVDGRARFVAPGVIAISGQFGALGNLPVLVTFSVQSNASEIVQVEQVAVQVLRIENSSFGWVIVPNVLVAQIAGKVKDILGSGYTVTSVQAGDASTRWSLAIEGR